MNKWCTAARKRREALDGQKRKDGDLDVLVEAMAKLPPGQLKKVLTEDVIAVLAKYGVYLG